MGCYNCKYLKENDKKEGKVNGCLYYCPKIKKYVNGATDECVNYAYDCTRKTYKKDEIYNDGKHFYNDDTSNVLYIFIIIILIILAIIVNV